MRRQPLVQKLCAEMTASLTPLPLPSQYYQNTNSSCKQKKNHYDAWSEDVLNHIQAATQKREFLFSYFSETNRRGASVGQTQGKPEGDGAWGAS